MNHNSVKLRAFAEEKTKSVNMKIFFFSFFFFFFLKNTKSTGSRVQHQAEFAVRNRLISVQTLRHTCVRHCRKALFQEVLENWKMMVNTRIYPCPTMFSKAFILRVVKSWGFWYRLKS